MACLPLRKSRGKGKEKETTLEREPPSNDEGEPTDVPNVTVIESEDAEEVAESNEVGQAKYAKARAVLNANIGACHVKLVSHYSLSLKSNWNLAAREITKMQSSRAQKVNGFKQYWRRSG